jgi:hypothetical protein
MEFLLGRDAIVDVPSFVAFEVNGMGDAAAVGYTERTLLKVSGSNAEVVGV